jgi:hypothetical protein
VDLKAELAKILTQVRAYMPDELFDQAYEFVENREYGLAYEWIEMAFTKCEIPRSQDRDERLIRIGAAMDMSSDWVS